MDIERAAGAVLHTATGVKVDLTQPALTVRVDLEADVVWIGTLLTDRPLSRRAKVYAQQIGLSADLAYAASHVLELSAPQRILDPFCGSGTLLLEAGALHSDCELWASDWAPSAVDGARRNLDAAGFTARSFVRELDALKMSETYPTASFDAIVCNPPFGVKMGKSINFYRFYHRLLAEADRVLKPNGKLAVWAHRRGQLNAAAASHAVFEPFQHGDGADREGAPGTRRASPTRLTTPLLRWARWRSPRERKLRWARSPARETVACAFLSDASPRARRLPTARAPRRDSTSFVR